MTHPTNPRFVIFSSYGNDSCALIQWAHEARLDGVAAGLRVGRNQWVAT